jgi:hypothetical protein
MRKGHPKLETRNSPDSFIPENKEGLKGKVQRKRRDRRGNGLKRLQVPVPALGTTQKIHFKFLQVNLPPSQGGIVPGIIKLHQHEVKLAAAKRTKEVGSDAIDCIIVPFFPQQNRFAVSLPARHPG